MEKAVTDSGHIVKEGCAPDTVTWYLLMDSSFSCVILTYDPSKCELTSIPSVRKVFFVGTGNELKSFLDDNPEEVSNQVLKAFPSLDNHFIKHHFCYGPRSIGDEYAVWVDCEQTGLDERVEKIQTYARLYPAVSWIADENALAWTEPYLVKEALKAVRKYNSLNKDLRFYHPIDIWDTFRSSPGFQHLEREKELTKQARVKTEGVTQTYGDVKQSYQSLRNLVAVWLTGAGAYASINPDWDHETLIHRITSAKKYPPLYGLGYNLESFTRDLKIPPSPRIRDRGRYDNMVAQIKGTLRAMKALEKARGKKLAATQQAEEDKKGA